jgi:uncharacterized membrane protein YgcG
MTTEEGEIMLSSSDDEDVIVVVERRRGDDAPPAPRPVYTSPPRTGSTDDAREDPSADELSFSPPLVSLILPCPDGAFPYLTPHMLRQCFPARRYPHLVLGIAVRDTCVVPTATGNRKEEGGDTKKPTPNGGLAGKKRTTNPRTAKKGHAFASASNHGGGGKTLVDPWLLEYRRTIVPTFDLWDDGHDGNDNSPNDPGGSQAATSGSKGKGGSSSKATSRGGGGGGGAPSSSSATALPAVSSNDKIWLKTPQGRLPLSADAYMEAALHLTRCGLGKSSEYVVPLFDAIPPPPPTTTTTATPAAKLASSTRTTTTASSSSFPPTAVASAKRKVQAVQRCQNWYRQCVQHTRDATRRHAQGGSGGSSPSSVVRVLAPVVLDPAHRPTPAPSRANNDESGRRGDDDNGDDDNDDDDDDLLHRQLLDQRADDSDEAEFGGCVLIGWHALDDVQRNHVVKRWQEHRRHAAQPVAPIPADPNADGNGFQKMDRGAAAVVVLKTRNLMQFLDAALLESDAIVRSRVLVACDLPSVWSRNRKAFVLRLPPPSRPTQGDGHRPVTASSWPPEKTRTETATGDSRRPKRPRIDPNSECDQGWLDENGCVNVSPHCDDGDVSRHPWFRDASPVIRGCPCATCRHHTRAYIYHLVCAKELLGEVLLFVHNLHHMLALVDRINQDNVSTSDSVTITEYITDQLPTGRSEGTGR